MIALLAMTLLVAGTCLGWFAHGACIRFERWANAMKEQYAASHIANEQELDNALRRVRVLRFEDHGPVRARRAHLAHE